MLFSGKRPVEAKLVGRALVAGFRNSSPRLVWRFDLEKNHSFSLALEGEEGEWEFGVTSPKGEFYPVARFAAREDADQAFAAVQKTLMRRKHAWLFCLMNLIGMLAVAVLAALLAATYIYGRGPAVSSPSARPPAIENGVPVPADRILRPPP